MRKRLFSFVVTVLAVLVMIMPAWAGNVDTFGIGAKATALGGAFSAYADDPFAIYYNPAGLTQIERPMLSLGANVIKPVIRVHDYQVTGMGPYDQGPVDIYDQSRMLVVPHLGFSMPIGKGFSAGIAAYVPFGLDIQWDKDISSGSGFASNPGAYNSYRSWYIREVVTPTVAYKFNDYFAVGVGISLGKTRCGVERLLFPLNYKIEADLDDDFNWSFNVGLMFKPVKSLAIGITYRGETDTELDGTFEVRGLQKVDAETEVDSPEQIQAGIRYMPNDRFSVEVDVTWTHWSVIDDYTVKFDQPILGISSEYFPRDWDDTYQFRLGAEWKVNPTIALRGSYSYDPTPIPDDTLDLQWPDADKHTFALGCGLTFGNLSIDGTVQYIYIEDKQIKINGESENLNNSYHLVGNPEVSLEGDGHLWGGALTVNYKF
ncbi:MAG: TonB-dependent receptor [Syntrophaceae bacterium]|nr:TonB-dependent receptor [Syntrophaceae bacterium]